MWEEESEANRKKLREKIINCSLVSEIRIDYFFSLQRKKKIFLV